MPNTNSAKKRIRQDEKRNLKKSALKSEAKTIMKRVQAAISAEDTQLAEKELKLAHSKLDRIASSNIWHKNKVARLKARLTSEVFKLQS